MSAAVAFAAERPSGIFDVTPRRRHLDRTKPTACPKCQCYLARTEPICRACVEDLPKAWPVVGSGNAHMTTMWPVNSAPCNGCTVCRGSATDDGKRETRAKSNPPPIARCRRILSDDDRSYALKKIIGCSPGIRLCYQDSRTDRWEWISQTWCELVNPSELVAEKEQRLGLDRRIKKAINRAQDWLLDQQRPVLHASRENSLPRELHTSESSNSAELASFGR